MRFVTAAQHIDPGLISEASALGSALDQVHRTCLDHRWPFPRLDRDLLHLRQDIDQLLRHFLDAALRFLAADSSSIWPGLSDPSDLVSGEWALPGSGDPLPPLATLILLAGDPSLSRDDLSDLGRVVAGLGNAVKPLVDMFGRVITAPTTLLSSPESRRMAERLAETPAARRVLAGLSRYSTSPLASAAERGLTALTLFEDANRLKRDGNPLDDAWRAKGAGYVADVAGAGFDVSSTACAQAPSYATCGAAAVSGTVWVAAEAWQRRDGIIGGLEVTSEIVISEVGRIRGLASRAVEEVGAARQDLIRSIRQDDRSPGLVRLPRFVTHTIADTLETTSDMAGGTVKETKRLLASGLHRLGL